jgi:hypothetical protein
MLKKISHHLLPDVNNKIIPELFVGQREYMC